MKNQKYIRDLGKGISVKNMGNKAISLVFFKRNNFSIPRSWILVSEAYDDFLKDADRVIEQIKDELQSLPDWMYAVRSSTSLEDSLDFSHAGQFETLLNISGTENLTTAIRNVWESASTLNHTIYPGSNSQKKIHCAVILQKMIPSVFSGVSFSRNPVSNHHEIVIEAIEGQGDSLMQKGVNPLRWRLRKQKLLEGDTRHEFFPVIENVAKATAKIEKLCRKPVDVEWAWDGDRLYFLQMRPMTGWKDLPVFSNKMAKEMLPGQIKPLVWSVNIPLVNGTWIGLISRITGTINVRPESLARPFYFRTYFNIAELGKLFKEFGISVESLEYLLTSEESGHSGFRPGFRMLRHIGRILRFLLFLWKYESFFMKELPKLETECRKIKEKLEQEYSLQAYPDLYKEIFDVTQQLVFLNILTPILMQIHNRRLKKLLQGMGVEYNRMDFYNDFPELSDYSPIAAMDRIRPLLEELPQDIRVRIKTIDDLALHPETKKVQAALQQFLNRFGHISESGNDFSFKKWGEDQDNVFRIITGSITHKRRKDMLSIDDLVRQGKTSAKLRRAYRRAGKYMLYREMISSLYIFGYGQFRSLFLRVGDDFTKRKVLNNRDDIFMLTLEELEGLIEGNNTGLAKEIKNRVAARKSELELTRDYILPTVIYGENAPVLESGKIKNYIGVGSSAGNFSGKARVIRKLEDFKAEDRGTVLIIPFSDISWTPILVQAGAIVSEAGGMLSHCSILARELGIPALVSVENACFIPDGTDVTVDGSNGILTIHEYGNTDSIR